MNGLVHKTIRDKEAGSIVALLKNSVGSSAMAAKIGTACQIFKGCKILMANCLFT